MAKHDQTPNLTLAIATGQSCDYSGCGNHGTVSKSRDGAIVRRCLAHLTTTKENNNNDYMLKFLGLI